MKRTTTRLDDKTITALNELKVKLLKNNIELTTNDIVKLCIQFANEKYTNYSNFNNLKS